MNAEICFNLVLGVTSFLAGFGTRGLIFRIQQSRREATRNRDYEI
jgi:hypothetical protein